MDKAKTEERSPISSGGIATTATASASSHAESLDVPDLSDPRLYINRELSWLAFNERVLAHTQHDGHPLLERVKFLAIAANNLDEFFMIRVATLARQHRLGSTHVRPTD
jgi:polyphosphate kinase